MARLPNPGSDQGTWGSILNDYLSQVHNANGTLKDGVVTAAQLAADAVSTATLAASNTPSSGQVLSYDGSQLTWIDRFSASDIADNSITTAKLVDGAVTAVKTGALDGGSATTPGFRIRPRRDTAANWASANPVLAAGEVGQETDSGIVKIGDGTTSWSNLRDAHAPAGLLLSRNRLPDYQTTLSTGESVTFSQSDTTTISGGTNYTPARIGGVSNANVDIDNDPTFRYGGTSSVQADAASPTYYVRAGGITGGSGQAARYWHTLRFCTDAPEFEFECRFVASTQKHRLYVDGKLSDYRTVTGSSAEFLKFTFASAKPRLIDLVIQDPSWHSVKVGTTYSVWKAPDFTRRFFIVGDSLTAGASGVDRIDTFSWELGRLLGCDETWNAGVGGTGWTSDGSGTTRFGDRTATDLLSRIRENDIVVFKGSRNDVDSAAITTTAQSVLQTLSHCRNIFLVGTITNLAQNARVSAAAAATGRPFIDLSTAITGTGNTASPNGSGNADRYIVNDNVHLSQAGHEYIGRRIYAGIRQNLPAF